LPPNATGLGFGRLKGGVKTSTQTDLPRKRSDCGFNGRGVGDSKNSGRARSSHFKLQEKGTMIVNFEEEKWKKKKNRQTQERMQLQHEYEKTGGTAILKPSS